MKKFFFLSLVLFLSILPEYLSADNVAVFPIGASQRSEWSLAKDVDRIIDRDLHKISAAKALSFREILSAANRKLLASCRADLNCQREISTKAGRRDIDFFLFSRLRFAENRDVVVQTYLFDRRYSRLETVTLEMDYNIFADEIADKLFQAWNNMLSRHVTKAAPPPRQRFDDDFDDDFDRRDRRREREDYGRPAPRTSEAIIAEGFRAYADGNLRQARSLFQKAASRDVVAQRLFNAVDEIGKYLARANASIKAKRYEEAIPIIAKAESLDESIKTLGQKYGVFYQEPVERKTYLEPTPRDMKVVESIHKRYAGKTEKARRDRAAGISEIDKWINQRIRDREAKMKQFVVDSENAAAQEKKELAELRKEIKELRHKWEQEDDEIEQKIVALESNLTLLEQRVKGVVKVSTEKEEKARKAELAAVDKKYKELLKKLREERNAFYEKQKAELEEGSKNVEAKVAKLQKQKSENEEAIRKIDKKIEAATREFEESERKYSRGTEGVRLKQEDEDRRFAVEVEKEYQAKFDELNEKLRAYDKKDAERREALKVFDREIEDFLMKNVEIMSAFQEDVEKERTVLDKKYKGKKETAASDAEKEWNKKLEDFTSEKNEIEAKIAEEETPALKKQLAQIEKKISAHEENKDSFIAEKVMQVEMEHEMKSAELDMKLVNRNNELQKENNAFRDKKLAEKKKAEADYKNFLKRKEDFRKSIERQVEMAQKDRDNKIEKRRKERGALATTWEKEAEKRKLAFEKSIQPDRNLREKLIKANEKIDDDIVKINDAWENRSQDIRIEHHTSSEKFEENWKERFSKTEEEFKEAREAVEDKYADKQLQAREAQKRQRVEWEEAIQALNEKKARNQKERQAILDQKRMEWEERQAERKREEEQRKIDRENFAEEMKRLNTEDRAEAAMKRKDVERRFKEATGDIYQAQIDEIRSKFPDDFRYTRRREVVGVRASENIQLLKASALAQSGLLKLQDRDILNAKRLFAETLFLDSNNKIALDGMRSIELTAKSMYWEAFGMRETDRAKAREIFSLLVQTLMPSSEYFVRAKIALEDL